ncbi:hypothetical protein [Cerasicoccus frondis]|uniref:hypothetical protein n=1 Tax=Cerasicoccus frondis TaxID=490090 RepID=UPI0028529116|nr:hypothetical protein [Cerasicoccus frondis]
MDDYTPKPSRRDPEARAKKMAEQERFDRAQQRNGAIGSLFKFLVVLALLGGGGYFAYQYYQGQAAESEEAVDSSTAKIVEKIESVLPSSDKDKQLTVSQKILVPGSLVDKEKGKTQKSKDYTDWVEPTYYLVCTGNTTNKVFYFRINESDYEKAFVGAQVQSDYASSWSTVSSRDFAQATGQSPVR